MILFQLFGASGASGCQGAIVLFVMAKPVNLAVAHRVVLQFQDISRHDNDQSSSVIHKLSTVQPIKDKQLHYLSWKT